MPIGTIPVVFLALFLNCSRPTANSLFGSAWVNARWICRVHAFRRRFCMIVSIELSSPRHHRCLLSCLFCSFVQRFYLISERADPRGERELPYHGLYFYVRPQIVSRAGFQPFWSQRTDRLLLYDRGVGVGFAILKHAPFWEGVGTTAPLPLWDVINDRSIDHICP